MYYGYYDDNQEQRVNAEYVPTGTLAAAGYYTYDYNPNIGDYVSGYISGAWENTSYYRYYDETNGEYVESFDAPTGSLQNNGYYFCEYNSSVRGHEESHITGVFIDDSDGVVDGGSGAMIYITGSTDGSYAYVGDNTFLMAGIRITANRDGSGGTSSSLIETTGDMYDQIMDLYNSMPSSYNGNNGVTGSFSEAPEPSKVAELMDKSMGLAITINSTIDNLATTMTKYGGKWIKAGGTLAKDLANTTKFTGPIGRIFTGMDIVVDAQNGNTWTAGAKTGIAIGGGLLMVFGGPIGIGAGIIISVADMAYGEDYIYDPLNEAQHSDK